MTQFKFIQKWSAQMAKAKKAVEHLRRKKEQPVVTIKPLLIDSDIGEKKVDELLCLVAKVIELGRKKGRPSKNEMQGLDYAA